MLLWIAAFAFKNRFYRNRESVCVTETEIEGGLKIVERQLADRTVHTGQEELFKSRGKELGSIADFPALYDTFKFLFG